MSFNDLTELMNYIKDNAKNKMIVSIDGWNDSGKSTLADIFLNITNFIVIHIDDFLNKNTGEYLNSIKYDDLNMEIDKSADENQIVVLEGNCILEILDCLNKSSDIKVYNKDVDINGCWRNERYVDNSKTVQEIIDDDESKLGDFSFIEGYDKNMFNSDDSDIVFKELIKYHKEYKPHENCDVLFENSRTA